jgi:serine phosphatase RsbU (regulator of sigma subunit)
MKKVLLLLCFSLFYLFAFGQYSTIFHIDSLPPQGVLLDKNWKFKIGDNPEWAKADFDDSDWESIDPTKDIFDLPQIPKDGQVMWFRLRFLLDSSLNFPLAFIIHQSGASEIFLNGKQIKTLGTISKNPNEIRAFDSHFNPIVFFNANDSIQIIAIRYAFQPNILYSTNLGHQNTLFSIRLNNISNANEIYNNYIYEAHRGNFLRIGALGILGILFFTLYLFFPSRKVNLYFSIYAFTSAISWLFLLITAHSFFAVDIYLNLNLGICFQVISYMFMLASVYITIEQKTSWFYWFLIGLGVFSVLSAVLFYGWGWLVYGFLFTNLINVDISRIAMLAWKKNKKGAWIIVTGCICFLISWLMFCLQFLGIIGEVLGINFFDISFFSIPVAFAIFLGYDFGLTNLLLEKKLVEVKTLSSEKQQILENQKVELEKQVSERTLELKESNEELAQTNVTLNHAFHEIEKKNEDITASINAALRIQNAMLPVPARFESAFGKENYFVLFKPRDIVSGDFYFLEEATFPLLEGGGGGEKIVLVCADCTGHGVPGAFMSMIGNQILTEIVGKEQITEPDKILNLLNKEINKVLKQNENQGREGMDVAVVTFTKKTNLVGFGNPQGFDKVEYAGAMNPIYYVQNGELKEIKADKKPIGGIQEESERIFTKHEIQLAINNEQLSIEQPPQTISNQSKQFQTILYLCSDGFQDQFGGAQGKKFMVKRFRELLFSIHHLPMHEQKQILDNTIEQWMAEGNEKQIDDILVMGMRV